MALEVPLPRLQRWMQNVVVHPGSTVEALKSPAAEAELPSSVIGDVILPSSTLSPSERVGVYHSMYLLRMEEALSSDYGALKHFLGPDGFVDLVRGYVQAHPSQTYTLNRLGDHLPEYVKTAPGLRRPDFCHDLARLELAITEVFDAEETPALSEAAIAAVPPEDWAAARLTPVAAFRLRSFRYPVNQYLQSVRDDDHDHPKPRLKDSWVAVYRRSYSVWRRELTRPAHDLLADLVAGKPLGESVESALGRGGRRAPTQDELYRWFQEWVAGGIFTSVTLDTTRTSPA